MYPHSYEKDQVCPGSSFLCSPAKANPAGAGGSSDAQTAGGGAQHCGRYSEEDRRRACGRRNHEDSHRTSYQHSRSDSHDMNRSWSSHHHNSYDSRHCQFPKSVSASDRREGSRSSSRYRYSRKSVSPFEERKGSRSSSRYRYSRKSVFPFNRQERSRSSSRYRYSRKSVSPFEERRRSRSSSRYYRYFHNRVSPFDRQEGSRSRFQYCFFHENVSPFNRRERSRSSSQYRYFQNSVSPFEEIERSRRGIPYHYHRKSVSPFNGREWSGSRNRLLYGHRHDPKSLLPSERRAARYRKRRADRKKRQNACKKMAAIHVPDSVPTLYSASRNTTLMSNSKNLYFSPASTRVLHGLGKKCFSADARSTAWVLPPKCPSQPCVLHSVSRLLVSSHRRGAVDQHRMHTAWVLSSAASLRRTESRKVSGDPQFCENLEHMTHMVANGDRSQLLCMWSVAGTALQQVQVLDVESRPRTRCGDLPLEFSLSDSVLRSWCDITSLCWADMGEASAVLYTTSSRTGQKTSCANIRFMGAVCSRLQYADYMLGHSGVWACAWNPGRLWLGVGLDQQCQVIDAFTRQFWKFQSDHGKVHCLEFSKADTGNSLYSGISSGVVLMHDVRKNGRKATVVVVRGHRRGICDLKLSPDERHLYTSDMGGQIRRWDLRMNRSQPVMSYEGLTNGHSRLPFHIDHTQSVLYAAGTDCCTKIWSLQSGELLQSLPPPYPAHPYTVPAVQLSTQWAGVPGTMGLIMGAHQDLHLYTSGV